MQSSEYFLTGFSIFKGNAVSSAIIGSELGLLTQHALLKI